MRHAIQFDEGLPLRNRLGADRLVQPGDRRDRHTGGPEPLHPGINGVAAQHGHDLLRQFFIVAGSVGDGHEARIGDEMLCTQHGRYPFPQPLIRRRDHQIAVTRAVHFVGRRDRVARTGPLRARACHQRGRGLVGDHAECRIDQRRLHTVNHLAALPRQHAGEDAHRNPLSGTQIDDRWRTSDWRCAVVPVHLHDAAEGLDQRIIARQITPDWSGPERIEGIIENVWVFRANCLLADAQSFCDAWPHALQQHVGSCSQRQCSTASSVGGQIQHHTALAGVHVTMHHADTVDRWRPMPRIVAPRRFDLDHVSAKLCQDHRGKGPCHICRKIDDPNP